MKHGAAVQATEQGNVAAHAKRLSIAAPMSCSLVSGPYRIAVL